MEREHDRDSVEDGDTREQGIEFGELAAKLEAHDYPTTSEDLVAAYGDFELGLPGGSATLREILETRRNEGSDHPEEIRYESQDDVHQSVHNLVDSEAVGRVGYSDRGGSQHGGDREQESL